MYFQDYWWLLIDKCERRETVQVFPPREPGVWPPFTGHRVPLGGDVA